MKKIGFEELMCEIENEKTINVSSVEEVVDRLLYESYEGEFDDFEDSTYVSSSRKKLRDIALLFGDMGLKIYGTASSIHNCVVSYARADMYDCCCTILDRALVERGSAIDLLADYILYGISCGQYERCEERYKALLNIPKEEWNWRAFSFSIDYLLDKLDRVSNLRERNTIKRAVIRIADEFVLKFGTDQAYFDKSKIIKAIGGKMDETEESVLWQGIEALLVSPKCTLRMADILFSRGEFKLATELLNRCCLNAFKPQPDINGSYSFLLFALSKTSQMFVEHNDALFDDKEFILDIYKDFNTAIESGLSGVYKGTANTAIKIISSQTGVEYPYLNADDSYDF